MAKFMAVFNTVSSDNVSGFGSLPISTTEELLQASDLRKIEDEIVEKSKATERPLESVIVINLIRIQEE